MDTQKILMEIQNISDRQDELKAQRHLLWAQEMDLRKEYAAYWGLSTYGLKVGDRIQWTKKTWRKESIITIEITHFEAFIRNETIEDQLPTIHGARVLKDGTMGKNTESWYSKEQDGKFVKL